MRAELSAHFDVLVVTWLLALAIGWCCFAVTHTKPLGSEWSTTDHSGPAWMYEDPNAGN